MPTRFVLAPAKVNLSLRVLGRREDGMHGVASLMVPVDLCDVVAVRPRPGSTTCSCAGVAAGENLAARAATALGVDAAIAIDKRIPIGAGLGGGSSDAAAVLRALGARHRLDVARALGADVPFFLCDGPAWATGTGADVTPIDDLPDFALVLCWPEGRSLETRTMYQALGRAEGGEPPPLPPRIDGSLDRLAAVVGNDFEEVACARVPEIAMLKRLLRQSDARAAAITGKGPAIFGLYASYAQAAEAVDWVLSLWPPGLAFWNFRATRVLLRSS